MRVLAIAQKLLARGADGEYRREGLAALCRHPGSDVGVVGGGARIGGAGEPAPQVERCCPVMRGEFGEEFFVIAWVGQHGDEIVVLRRAADQRRTADIDVFDALVPRSAARDRRREGVEVRDDKIDGANSMVLQRRAMRRLVTSRQDAAMERRVERLDPPVEHLREVRLGRDVGDLDAGIDKRARRAAGRQDLDAAGRERLGERHQAPLIEYRDQRPFDRAERGVWHDRFLVISQGFTTGARRHGGRFCRCKGRGFFHRTSVMRT